MLVFWFKWDQEKLLSKIYWPLVNLIQSCQSKTIRDYYLKKSHLVVFCIGQTEIGYDFVRIHIGLFCIIPTMQQNSCWILNLEWKWEFLKSVGVTNFNKLQSGWKIPFHCCQLIKFVIKWLKVFDTGIEKKSKPTLPLLLLVQTPANFAKNWNDFVKFEGGIWQNRVWGAHLCA